MLDCGKLSLTHGLTFRPFLLVVKLDLAPYLVVICSLFSRCQNLHQAIIPPHGFSTEIQAPSLSPCHLLIRTIPSRQKMYLLDTKYWLINYLIWWHLDICNLDIFAVKKSNLFNFWWSIDCNATPLHMLLIGWNEAIDLLSETQLLAALITFNFKNHLHFDRVQKYLLIFDTSSCNPQWKLMVKSSNLKIME